MVVAVVVIATSCNCCMSAPVMCMMCGEYFGDCCDDCEVCGGGSGSDSGGGGRKKNHYSLY